MHPPEFSDTCHRLALSKSVLTYWRMQSICLQLVSKSPFYDGTHRMLSCIYHMIKATIIRVSLDYDKATTDKVSCLSRQRMYTWVTYLISNSERCRITLTHLHPSSKYTLVYIHLTYESLRGSASNLAKLIIKGSHKCYLHQLLTQA